MIVKIFNLVCTWYQECFIEKNMVWGDQSTWGKQKATPCDFHNSLEILPTFSSWLMFYIL